MTVFKQTRFCLILECSVVKIVWKSLLLPVYLTSVFCVECGAQYPHILHSSIICITFYWPSWSWSHGSWIYNYLCHHWMPITTNVVSSNPAQARCILDTTLC